MTADAPPLTGRELLDFKSSISGIDADLRQYERALAEYRRVCSPIGTDATGQAGRCAERPDTNDVPATAGRVRVLLTGVPTVHGAERVVQLIEDAGGLVVAAENCTGLKPILDDVDASVPDPLRALAAKYFHLPCSIMTRNDRRLEVLRQLAAAYRVQCVVELIWQACLTYDVEAHRVRRLAEESLGLPYLRIETDYSPADSARIQVRIEALFETVRDERRGALRTEKASR
jgi:hypothetical protein